MNKYVNEIQKKEITLPKDIDDLKRQRKRLKNTFNLYREYDIDKFNQLIEHTGEMFRKQLDFKYGNTIEHSEDIDDTTKSMSERVILSAVDKISFRNDSNNVYLSECKKEIESDIKEIEDHVEDYITPEKALAKRKEAIYILDNMINKYNEEKAITQYDIALENINKLKASLESMGIKTSDTNLNLKNCNKEEALLLNSLKKSFPSSMVDNKDFDDDLKFSYRKMSSATIAGNYKNNAPLYRFVRWNKTHNLSKEQLEQITGVNLKDIDFTDTYADEKINAKIAKEGRKNLYKGKNLSPIEVSHIDVDRNGSVTNIEVYRVIYRQYDLEDFNKRSESSKLNLINKTFLGDSTERYEVIDTNEKENTCLVKIYPQDISKDRIQGGDTPLITINKNFSEIKAKVMIHEFIHHMEYTSNNFTVAKTEEAIYKDMREKGRVLTDNYANKRYDNSEPYKVVGREAHYSKLRLAGQDNYEMFSQRATDLFVSNNNIDADVQNKFLGMLIFEGGC